MQQSVGVGHGSSHQKVRVADHAFLFSTLVGGWVAGSTWSWWYVGMIGGDQRAVAGWVGNNLIALCEDNLAQAVSAVAALRVRSWSSKASALHTVVRRYIIPSWFLRECVLHTTIYSEYKLLSFLFFLLNSRVMRSADVKWLDACQITKHTY